MSVAVKSHLDTGETTATPTGSRNDCNGRRQHRRDWMWSADAGDNHCCCCCCVGCCCCHYCSCCFGNVLTADAIDAAAVASVALSNWTTDSSSAVSWRHCPQPAICRRGTFRKLELSQHDSVSVVSSQRLTAQYSGTLTKPQHGQRQQQKRQKRQQHRTTARCALVFAIRPRHAKRTF